MGHLSPEQIKSHVSRYIFVFAALLVLTVVTVGVSYLHLPSPQSVVVAIAIAAVKASLVAAIFMHLLGEKRIIFAILLVTIFFFIFLLVYPALHAL